MAESTDRLSSALADRYRLERRLGEGGMATVYLAEDLKDGRNVAVKVLRPELAAVLGPDRFVHEIKTTAGLQHPHILPLFDSGHARADEGGQAWAFLFYVMPYVDGETLREKLNRETQLTVDEAVRIASDVAEALDYAHRHGVIHRDIKPENILLHDGRPVVADFGIALAVSAAAGGRMTETGLSLGTPHYMSPEQATAEKELTGRSDIYSLGSVLYEMLTGEPPHTGASAQAIITKLVTDTPRPVTELRKAVPPNVTATVEKSLEKLAADRFATAGAMARALSDPDYRTARTVSEPRATPSTRLAALFAALAAVFAVAFGWSVLAGRPEVAPPVNRFLLPYDLPPFSTGALARDGSFFVYDALDPSGQSRLWVRRWEELDPRPIPGTEGAVHVGAVSPDGREVAYQTNVLGPLLVKRLDGGPARELVAAQWGATDWSEDGIVYFTAAGPGGVGAGIGGVAAAGGPVESVTSLREGELAHGYLHVLPSGRSAVFTVWRSIDGSDSEIWAVDLTSGERTRLIAGQRPYHAASGHLIFANDDGSLMAAPFDPDAVKLTGPAIPVVSRVLQSTFLRIPLYTFAKSGTLVYRAGPEERGRLVLVDRESGTRDVMADWRSAVDPAFSPQGDRVALVRDRNVYVVPLDGTPSTQLSYQGRNSAPAWSPDGRVVYFLSDRLAAGQMDVFSIRADGSGQAELFYDAERNLASIAWTPDGEWLLMTTTFEGPTSSDILGVRTGADGERETVPLVTSPFPDRDPSVSPDGRWLAYASSGGVIVAPFPNTGGARWPVAGGGSAAPQWVSDGAELLYTDVDATGDTLHVHAARVSAGDVFSVTQPPVLLSAHEARSRSCGRTQPTPPAAGT